MITMCLAAFRRGPALRGLFFLLVAAVARAAEAPPADYVLQPQDVLRVQVFQEEDINRLGEVSVSQEHTIVLPLIKTVSVKGRTARQAEDLIRELYSKDYLVNPQVQVIVLKYAERSVNVMGAVINPGRVPFTGEGRLTLLEAIGNAGGPNRLANMKKVTLTRKRPSGETTSQEINAEELRTRGGQDIPLEKGDTIFVAERII
ncbi:MAG: polysaccharide export protein [Opitutaceae bacterium]|nr:polysaccharide export protein [Opitutaceae bacterium]